MKMVSQVDSSHSRYLDMPIFTTEFNKYLNPDKKKTDDEGMQDDDIEEGSSESVSSFGDDGNPEKKVKDDYPSELEDSEEEKEDYTIRKTDAIIVTATAENEHSNLEVYIYDHKTSDLYVHHEIILGSYPLCLEWLPTWRGQKANLMIVGTFLPQIEIWNLDREDCEPIAVLGGLEEDKKKKKSKIINQYNKKAPTKQINEHSHSDAVMTISLNPFQSEYLASGSADTTVRIWDIEEEACKATFSNLHTDKVQLVRWNKQNEQVLLSGGYDRLLNVVDVRERPLGENAIRFKLPKEAKDLESGNWHPKYEHNFVVSSESGMVFGYDIRQTKGPLFSI